MRVDSSYNRLLSNQRTNGKQGSDFLSYMIQEADKKEKQEKEEDNKGKLITAREGAYVRQYLVRADGSKVLLSEIKQEDAMADNVQHPAASIQPDSRLSANTEELMSLLNFQAGAGQSFRKVSNN